MRKRYLGIVCFVYAFIIIYVILTNNLKNYLAPNMQNYIKLSIIPLIIMGMVFCLNDKINYKFKLSDLVLLFPLIMFILSGDGRLSMNFSNNRNNGFIKKNGNDVQVIEDVVIKEVDASKYDFDNVYFDVVDASYDGLVNYLTYNHNAIKYDDKTIRVRGFTNMEASFIPNGYFAIGKYSISCCAADATYVGFIAKYDKIEIKNNTWYQIEGVLFKSKDNNNSDIMAINVVNIEEINNNNEDQYVYACYAYDDGKCAEIAKYNLEY